MFAISRPTAPARAFGLVLMLVFFWLLAARADDGGSVYTLQVDGLACPFCAYGIEKQLGKLEGVEAVETDVKSGTVTITMEEGATLDEADAERAVDRAGFTMRDFRQREQT